MLKTETMIDGGCAKVVRERTYGSDRCEYSVWIGDNPHTPAEASRFGTVTHDDNGVRWGRLGTIAGSNRTAQYITAYVRIREVYPGLEGVESNGKIFTRE